MQSKNKSLYLIFIFLLVSLQGLYAQKAAQVLPTQTIRISGFVNEQNGKNLSGASLYDTKTRQGGVTTQEGYFSFLVQSPCVLKISYIGYQSLEIPIHSSHDTLLSIQLLSVGTELKGVEVQAKRKTNFNISSMSIAQINAIPSMTGKPDIIKALRFTPGFETQGEASSVLMVRGGNASENQFMLDNIPLLYVNHLAGYFSVFNPDMVESVQAYKGGFLPRYGGKLSSMINIVQKKGNSSHLKGNLSVGLSDISFAIEGPLAKNVSFMFAGRKTFIDAYYALVTRVQSGDYNSLFIYGFHDINAKVSWTADAKNQFDFSIYQGDDYLSGRTIEKLTEGKTKQRMSHTWGNILGSVHWKRSISPKWYVDNSLSYTRYRLKEKTAILYKPSDLGENQKNIYRSAIGETSLRSHWEYAGIEPWSTHFGLQLSSYNFSEGVNTLDAAIYWDNTLLLADWFDINIGFRSACFVNKKYTHFSFEPRANLAFHIGKNQSINVGYTRMTQNLQMVLVAGALLSNETWFPSGDGIPVSYSNQYTLAWKGDFNKQMFETEVGVYYKDLRNLSTLKDGYTSIKGDPYWEQKIARGGEGTAYGLEFSFRKMLGIWTGFISYSYSRSFRNYAELNQGKTYVFEYDRPHTASFGLNWKVNAKWDLSLVWMYQTGFVYTPAIGRISVPSLEENGKEFYEALLYGERNSARTRDFHRMDISAQYHIITKRGRRACWTFSISNLYSRQNPTFYFYDDMFHSKGDAGAVSDPQYNEFQPLRLYQISPFCFMPMFSYKVYFDKLEAKNKQSSK